jgi:hypothetical protein
VGNSQSSGYLADVFDQLPDLTRLVFLTIKVGGTLPPTIGQLGKLNWIEIGNTQIGGPIPSAWSGLTSLQTFRLYNMNLNGTIPDIFGGMSRLSSIVLSALPFCKHFACLLSNRGSATECASHVAKSTAAGPFPGSLGNVTSLTSLTFAATSITGSLPAFSTWTQLTSINFQTNAFNGSFLSSKNLLNSCMSILKCSRFTHTTGTLPDTWKLYNKVSSIVLAGNAQLNSTLPSSWSNMTLLGKLDIGYTQACSE